jgi:hypothetical protein
MTKEDFNKLTVLKQLEYINSLLEKGESLRKISEQLKMSKTTFRARFFSIGYARNEDTNQYCYDSNIEIQSQLNTTKTPHMDGKPVSESIENNVNTKELQKYYNEKMSQNYNKDMLELINKKAELLEMVECYKNNTKIIKDTQLNINFLPQEMKRDIINKSIKVYEQVYKTFDEVCSQFSGIKKQDIISLALYEFCKKYKK